MAVSIGQLENAIKAAFNAEKEKMDDQQGSIDRISRTIAEAVASQIVQGINTATVTPILANSAGTVTGTITIKSVAQ